MLSIGGLFSDLQIRGGRKPDGVCLVVGSCARGFKDNSTSDVIYSSSSAKTVGNAEVQYFWEVNWLFAVPLIINGNIKPLIIVYF